MTRVIVTVTPREGVLDPQGQAVQISLDRLGFGHVDNVRIGKRIELDIPGDDPEGQARRMCEALLADPLIEDYAVSVEA